MIKGDPMISSVALTKRAVPGMALRQGGYSCVTIPYGLIMVCMFWGEYSKGIHSLHIQRGKGKLIIKMSVQALLDFFL